MTTNVEDGLRQAIGMFGSEAKLGAACGVGQTSIWKAKRSGWVSARLAIGIEAATGGAVSRSQLRPDLWAALIATREDAWSSAAEEAARIIMKAESAFGALVKITLEFAPDAQGSVVAVAFDVKREGSGT